MSALQFEWDETKARSNARKHGVTFEEDRTVFFDEQARVIDDPEHSRDEARFLILGLSSRLHLLIVAHCYRADDGIIRIISARRATRSEARFYP